MVTKFPLAGLLLAAALMSGCTVVDLDENGKPIIPKDPTAQTGFRDMTPQQVAEESWDSRVVKRAEEQALSWTALKSTRSTLKPGSSVFVKASGTVTAVSDAADRERLLTVAIDGESVPVMLGPVIRSNAIRDAANYKFEEFTNQVQFARLTKALNQRAVKHLPAVDASWVSKPVQMLLAVTVQPDRIEDAVAVSLKQGQP